VLRIQSIDGQGRIRRIAGGGKIPAAVMLDSQIVRASADAPIAVLVVATGVVLFVVQLADDRLLTCGGARWFENPGGRCSHSFRGVPLVVEAEAPGDTDV